MTKETRPLPNDENAQRAQKQAFQLLNLTPKVIDILGHAQTKKSKFGYLLTASDQQGNELPSGMENLRRVTDTWVRQSDDKALIVTHHTDFYHLDHSRYDNTAAELLPVSSSRLVRTLTDLPLQLVSVYAATPDEEHYETDKRTLKPSDLEFQIIVNSLHSIFSSLTTASDTDH